MILDWGGGHSYVDGGGVGAFAGVPSGGSAATVAVLEYGYGYRGAWTRPAVKRVTATGILTQAEQRLYGMIVTTPYRDHLAAILLSDEE